MKKIIFIIISLFLLGGILFSGIIPYWPYWGSTKGNLKIYCQKVDIASIDFEILSSGLLMYRWKIGFTEKYSNIPYLTECFYPVKFGSIKHKIIGSGFYQIKLVLFYNKYTGAIEYYMAYWMFSFRRIKILEPLEKEKPKSRKQSIKKGMAL